MNKVSNIICLVLWTISLAMGIVLAVIGEPINPITFVCAAAFVVCHYIDKLILD